MMLVLSRNFCISVHRLGHDVRDKTRKPSLNWNIHGLEYIIQLVMDVPQNWIYKWICHWTDNLHFVYISSSPKLSPKLSHVVVTQGTWALVMNNKDCRWMPPSLNLILQPSWEAFKWYLLRKPFETFKSYRIMKHYCKTYNNYGTETTIQTYSDLWGPHTELSLRYPLLTVRKTSLQIQRIE